MEKLDLAFFGYIGIATLCTAITIVLVTNRAAWLPVVARMVSIVSDSWRVSVEQARQQKARRERLYGFHYVEDEAVLDRNGTGFTGGFDQNENAVLIDTNQAEPNQFAEVQAFLSSHNLTDEQAIIIFALMRRQNGETYLSANKIRDTVGGADKDVKDQVAAYRPRPPAPPQGAPLKRPVNGW